jgi:Flp pilus assembly protein TadB
MGPLFSDAQILVPLAGILVAITGIALPAVLVWLVLHYRQRRTERLFETVRHLADRGLPVPHELLDPPRRAPPADSPLSRGLVLIGAGAGLAVMFWTMGLTFLVGIGAVLGCIGVAMLIAYTIERGRSPDADAGAGAGPATGGSTTRG